MFVGHTALALAGKGRAPRTSLRLLPAAAAGLDLLWPGPSPLLGLGFWDSVPATVLVEGMLLLAGVLVYVRSTRPLDRTGSCALWSLLLVQAAFGAYGPWAPPPSPSVLAWFSLGVWRFVRWAWWADRHRVARAGARA